MKAEDIVDAIKRVMLDKDVQPGYPDANGNTKTTWCNRGACRIATALGFDMKPFLNEKGINWTTANDMFNNAVKNAIEVQGEVAQRRTNDNGELFLAACFNPKGSGHVAIVCPSYEEYDNTLGPLVGETGARVRITHSRLAFEKWGYTARFFKIPEKR